MRHTDSAADTPSKTQVKQAMRELQDLGTQVLTLPEAVLDGIPMEDGLREALRELPRIRSFEARRRHSKYIGKLLRQADPEPFRRALEAHRQAYARDARALEQVEHWRERLLADDASLTQWLATYPCDDVPRLRSLIRNARAEAAAAEAAAPPEGAARKGRHYRELFQVLRTALQAGPATDT